MYLHLVNSIYTQAKRMPFILGGAPTFQTLIVNNMGRGNNTFDVNLSRNVESPGADPSLGWTIEISPDNVTWSTLDLTGATVTITDNMVKFTLAGNRTTIDATHNFRTSYSSVTGDIRNVNGGTDLATFGPDTTFANNSSSDLVSDIEDWYQFSEGSGTTRSAEINGSGYDLADVNTVGVRTGASGAGNALDFTGTNYLFKNGIFDAPADGKFSIAFYYIQDVLPSVEGSGDAYPLHRWRTTNDRVYAFVIPDDTAAPQQIDTPYIAGQNSSNSAFTQHFKNRGAFTNATWYAVVMVFDPDASIPVIGYTQQINTPGDFTTEDDNYVAPASGDPQCKVTAGNTDFIVGDFKESAPNSGVNGGLDNVIKWDRALTSTEAAAFAEYIGTPPFLPDTA